jgi:phosphoglycerate dehydrogenase-like enzyme
MAVVCLPERIEDLDIEAAIRSELPLAQGAEAVFWDGERRPDRADEVEFVLTPPLFKAVELLRSFPRLTVVQTVSAGVDRILPHVPEGVTLCDARGVHGGAVAEWALAATLAVVREVPRFVQDQAVAEWNTITTDELTGKRVLVIGAGDLGQNIARRLAAFDAEPTLVARSAREGVRPTSELPSLLPDAEIVIVVVPLTEETTRMVDARFLGAMPDGALLVNAARGPVVDTEALLSELSAGRLKAALDVTDPEPLPPGHPLWRAPGVLITPHVAGNVPGFPRRALQLAVAQVERFVAGEQLENVVSSGY